MISFLADARIPMIPGGRQKPRNRKTGRRKRGRKEGRSDHQGRDGSNPGRQGPEDGIRSRGREERPDSGPGTGGGPGRLPGRRDPRRQGRTDHARIDQLPHPRRHDPVPGHGRRPAPDGVAPGAHLPGRGQALPRVYRNRHDPGLRRDDPGRGDHLCGHVPLGGHRGPGRGQGRPAGPGGRGSL